MDKPKRPKLIRSLDVPPVWMIGCIVLSILIDVAAPWTRVHIAGATAFGAGLFGVGLGLILWSIVWFRRQQTPIQPHRTPKSLIIGGPYRFTRNPIYLAFVLQVVAFAFFIGSPLGLLVAGVLWRILERRFIIEEERRLVETFGPDAETYLHKTRRWL